jgi:mRNA interferase MazF
MIRRGDVIIVDFPFTDTGQSKVRPAVVVQNDRDNQRVRKTVIAMVTGNLRRRNEPTHLFVDPAHPDGASSGLSSRPWSSATTYSPSSRRPSSR